MNSKILWKTIQGILKLTLLILFAQQFSYAQESDENIFPLPKAAGWVHPGVLVTQSQLDYIKEQIKTNDTYKQLLDKAKKSNYGKQNYVIQGPPATGIIQCGSYSNPDYGCRAANSDSAAAYLQAVLWAVTGEKIYADNAIKILNTYGKNLIGYAGASPTVPCPEEASKCSNGPLQAAWDAQKWPRAAEIIRYANGGTAGWDPSDITQFTNMLERAVVPAIYNGSPFNGNWELSMIEAMMGIAVFTENESLFKHAQSYWSERVPAYFYNFNLDGSKPAPFPLNRETSNGWNGQEIFNANTSGVMQETCRDLQHSEMGLAGAINSAETDFIQKQFTANLYEANGAKERLIESINLLAGLEMTNSTTAPNDFCSGDGNKLVLGGIATFTMAYNHFHNRLQDAKMADATGSSGLHGTANTFNWIQKGVLTQNFFSDSGAKMVILEPFTHYSSPHIEKPSYILALSPSTQSIVPGSNTTYLVNLNSLGEYQQNVTLSVDSVLPSGVSVQFNPTQINSSSPTSTLTIITAQGTPSGNYTLTISGNDGLLKSSASAKLIVAGADTNLKISADNKAMFYTNSVPKLTFSVFPNIPLSVNASCYTTATSASLPGTYPIVCNGAQKPGYSIAYVDGVVTVNPLIGTITARDKSIKLGSTIPTSFRYSRSPSVALTKEPTCSTTAKKTSPKGTYPIACTGAEAVGYAFDYIDGTLTIR